jgi:Cu(I)/Ag(I) efflux system membrane fusion protein
MKLPVWLPRAGAALLLSAILSACSKPAPDPERRVKFYQSPMHPWITSDRPGNCTICGMKLVPVYEGEAGVSSDLITLSDSSKRVLGVETAPVRRAELTRALRFSGIFEDDDNLHRIVAAFYDGRIEKVYVDHVGQYVEKGQPLAAIYSPELLYVVREFQTAAGGGNQEIARTSARRLVQYGLSAAQVEGLAHQKEPAYTIDLLSPISGTILVRKAYQGQYIKTGEPLFELGNLGRLWFHAEVYEQDLPGVRIGQKAVLNSPAVPGRDFEGTVTFIDPNFDPVSRSTKVRIEVQNPSAVSPEHGLSYLLPHRSFGEARISGDLGEALVAPRSAILRDGRRAIAYVEKAPGAYESREVRTGRVGDDGIEILSGLKEGERVVTRGNLMIDAEAQLRGPAEVKP